MNFQRGFAWVPLLIAIILMLGVSGGAYYYVHQNAGGSNPLSVYLQPAASSTTQAQTQTNVTNTSANLQASNVQTYTNTQYGFSLQYPSDVASVDPSVNASSQTSEVVNIGIGRAYDSNFVRVDVSKNTTNCANKGSGSVVIGGVNFTQDPINDVGAGQLGLGYVYSAIHNNLCYSVTAHYLGNSPNRYQGAEAARIDAQNKAGVAVVDTIARSFRFVTSSNSQTNSGLDAERHITFGGNDMALEYGQIVVRTDGKLGGSAVDVTGWSIKNVTTGRTYMVGTVNGSHIILSDSSGPRDLYIQAVGSSAQNKIQPSTGSEDPHDVTKYVVYLNESTNPWRWNDTMQLIDAKGNVIATYKDPSIN